jgi:cytochrome c-type biogenesis protein CcmH
VKSILAILFLAFSFNIMAESKAEYPFTSPKKQQQFYQLIKELRCLVCQNQNLLDSYATLAVDFKNKIYTQVLAGNSNVEIKSELQKRYGDFIFFKPPFKVETLILWLAPVLMLLGALGIFIKLNFYKSRNY